MADIVPVEPFRWMDRDFGNLRRMMERVFDDSFFRSPALSEDGSLALDVMEKDGKVVVKASLPGFKKEEIDVQVHEGALYIKAEHNERRARSSTVASAATARSRVVSRSPARSPKPMSTPSSRTEPIASRAVRARCFRRPSSSCGSMNAS